MDNAIGNTESVIEGFLNMDRALVMAIVALDETPEQAGEAEDALNDALATLRQARDYNRIALNKAREALGMMEELQHEIAA